MSHSTDYQSHFPDTTIKNQHAKTLVSNFLRTYSNYSLDTIISQCLTHYGILGVDRNLIAECIKEYIDNPDFSTVGKAGYKRKLTGELSKKSQSLLYFQSTKAETK